MGYGEDLPGITEILFIQFYYVYILIKKLMPKTLFFIKKIIIHMEDHQLILQYLFNTIDYLYGI